MTWAQILGGPHGGASPTPQLDDLPTQQLYPGDTLVLTGTGLTPGSKVMLDPGARVIGLSSPTDTTGVSLTVPYGLPNIKHVIYITNGNVSNKIDLFVLRDVTLTPSTNTTANVTLVEAN